MRMIPGKTKVKMQLFRGVSIADAVIGATFFTLIVLIFSSSLPGARYIALGLLLVGVGLLVRVKNEPDYLYLLRFLRHLGYKRHYGKMYSDELLLARYDNSSSKELAFDRLFANESEKHEHSRKEEYRALKKRRNAQYKDEEKLLESDEVSEDVKQEILDRRAKENMEMAKEAAEEKEEELERYMMTEVIPFTDIEDSVISYAGEYYGAVIEISPVEFRFFSQYRRSSAIESGLGRVLRNLGGSYAANIVKLERPINYNAYRECEYKKLEALRASYEQGFMTEAEYQSRVEVLFDRLHELTDLCTTNKVVVPFYYFVVFDHDKQQLNLRMKDVISTLEATDLPVRRLDDRDLALFLKYSNQIDFREDEVDHLERQDYVEWAMPSTVDIKRNTVEVNHIVTYNFVVNHYPTMVGDSWLASVMSIPNTKVVVKCRPMDRMKAIHNIDWSLQELRGQYTSTGVDSRRVSLAEHIDTLSHLLSMLQDASETLLETNVYVTAYDIEATRENLNIIQPPKSLRRNYSNFKQMVCRYYREAELNLDPMDFNQLNTFVGSQISGFDPFAEKGQAMPSNSLAACYPWIFANVSDVGGIKMGTFEHVPVFVDFFLRDKERVNSNMVIVGKTGSGKSYAAKALLTNLAAEDAKIFVLDPENEYTELAENLHGKFINVGNAQQGRLNPFHIITALEDDEADSQTVSGSYATHLQFLEEFFRQILPDCDKDALEYLNALVDRLYANMGITAATDLSQLKPEDYPTFDNLYEMVLSNYQTANSDYVRSMLRTLVTYVGKFAADGRNANIWNGPSTVTTAESFTVFNFQSLLANHNNTVANAQMLLVLKYIDNEIIKNRDYNEKYGLNRKIVVVIDEAHVFIDTKFPIALDFMYQLAKRIRKYNGMQIVITQNIKDFVGSEEIARKSAAIINACQYSLIFSLAPNDMQDLCKLYEKAGGINEIEQDKISTAPQGKAFAVISPQSRSNIEVSVPEGTVRMFSQRGHTTEYYGGEDGIAAWDKFVGKSRELNLANAAKKLTEEAWYLPQTADEGDYVTFAEISEEELTAELHRLLARRADAQAFREEETAAATHAFMRLPQKNAADEAENEDAMKVTEIKRTVKPGSKGKTKHAVKSTRAVKSVSTVAKTAQIAHMSESRNVGTEETLAQILSKFSYDSLAAEIRRSVKEEIAAAGMTSMAPTTVNTVPPMETAVPAQEEQPISSQDFTNRLLAEVNGSSEATVADDTAAGSGETSVAFASVFNEDALNEAARLNEEESKRSNDDDGFDVMALLDSEVEKIEDKSAVDMMDIFGEKVIDVSLEELVKYNKKR